MRFLFKLIAFLVVFTTQLVHAGSNSPINNVQTRTAPDVEGAYSQGVVLNFNQGKLIFVAGQIPRVPESGLVANEDIVVATRQTLDNLQAILKAAGSDLKYVVRTDVFLKDANDWARFNTEYAKHFVKGHYPARQTVQVAMANKIEISCIAYIPKS